MTLGKKDIAQLSVTLVLGVVLVVVLAGQTGRKKTVKSNLSAAKPVEAVVPVAVKNPLFARLKEQTKDLEGGRDPFQRYEPEVPKSVSLPVLNGILWDPVRPTAIVNQQIAGQGDQIDGFVVVTIQQDRVLLNDGQKDFEVLMNPEP